MSSSTPSTSGAGSSQPDDRARPRPVTVSDVRAFRERGERFVMVTAYDAITAAILDDAGVPVLLVGDSLGMVVLGHDTTLPVTVDDLAVFTAAVRRGTRTALVVADMPFGSYSGSVDDAAANAVRLVKAGAHAVKLEGGGRTVEVVERLVAIGVPVMGHVGLTPQHVHAVGGFKVQGRDAAAADRIVADARSLADAGAFSLVLESVPSEVGRRVTAAVDVPTIGIGAGPDTTGQVLVVDDLVGRTSGPLPRFVKAYADVRAVMTDAVKAFTAEVASGDYPGPEHQY